MIQALCLLGPLNKMYDGIILFLIVQLVDIIVAQQKKLFNEFCVKYL